MAEGLAREGFDLDLHFGEARETAFVDALTDCHVECKSDQKARSTGNVAIEIRQGHPVKGRGRNSGLSVTVAKWWAIEYDDDAWLVIRTSTLKAVTKMAWKQNGSILGGDNHNEIVLVPVEWLIRPWRGISRDAA